MVLTRLLLLTITFMSSAAFAFPLPRGEMADLTFNTQMSANYDFEGIIGLSNCSASLVRFETSKDSDQALVFTNGHCLEFGMPDPGEVVSNQNSTRRMNLLKSDASIAGTVRAIKVVYSTMTNTDLTIYKLQETYADIQKQFGIEALILASAHPQVTMPIEVISGYWKKGYSCSVEAFIPELHEAGWVMQDSIRYSRPGCETIGGTSGSPVILGTTRTMIGINNTGNEDGEKCTMNNPCEIDSEGQVTYEQGYSYGQETYWVYTCLNEKNELDLKKEGCLLPR
jgi:V8-like Glu-specific endopeptidase